MAGNIVKWWKHKILGGYKQFTVLQECATDSEELIYPGRAPSACSAPPDLLLTSDREQMLKVKSSSSSAGAGTGHTKASHHHHHHQHHPHHQHPQSGGQNGHHHPHQQQHHHHQHQSNGHQHSGGTAQQQQQQQHHKAQKDAAFRKCSAGKGSAMAGTGAGGSGGGAGANTNTLNTTAATIRSDPDRVRLEEFTCDVSLEDGKKPQPLQFSFTLYDLDGHGKITKDDIAGIVSTIYESIGKSVVVPHYGSKTINVRLTVSPDGGGGGRGKTSATKPSATAAATAAAAAAVKKAIVTPRRRGYRSRKLLSDDDGSDTSENCPRMLLRNRTAPTGGAVSSSTPVSNTATSNGTANHVAGPPNNQHHHHQHHAGGKESNPSKAGAAGEGTPSAANTSATATLTPTRSSGLSKSSEATSPAPPVETACQQHSNSLAATGVAGALNNHLVISLAGKQQQQQQQGENVYESISNLKCCNLAQQQQQQSNNNNNPTVVPHAGAQSPLSGGGAAGGGAPTNLTHSSTGSTALICRDCIVDGGGPLVAVSGCHRLGERHPRGGTLEALVIPTSAAATLVHGAAHGRSKRAKLIRKTRSARKLLATTATLTTATSTTTATATATTAAAAAQLMAMEELVGGRPRARSLSVGNENCYENVIGRVTAAAPGECWKSSLCRRELIEIIRESMVKNSLCFQPNRKAMDSSPKHRHRSHTIASRVGEQVFLNYHHHPALAAADLNNGGALVSMVATAAAAATAAGISGGHEANLCGYDSYLHRTICAAANGGGGVGAANGATVPATAAATIHLAIAPAAGAHAPIQQPLQTTNISSGTPNRLLQQQQHLHHVKAKRKEQRMALAAATGTIATHQPPAVKLSTALLNQQYPNLSAEQKLTRSINQVEQWLDHRSPKGPLGKPMKPADDGAPSQRPTAAPGRGAAPGPLRRTKSKEELRLADDRGERPELLLLDNLRLSEDIAELAVVTPRRAYNKESLIASATKKNIKTHHQHHQRATAGATAVDSKSGSAPTVSKAASGDAPLLQLQYGSVPVNADPSECENLIRMSDDGEDDLPAPPPLASVRNHHHQPHQQSRSQPPSPQHHQHCGAATAATTTTTPVAGAGPTAATAPSTGGAHSVSSASAASTTAVHRYVHEHIHHHYHHFENDPDES